MGSYVWLYSGSAGMAETKEEQDRVMQAWTDWFAGFGAAITEPGNPFAPQAKRVGPDGSMSQVQADATGYSVVSADSLDAAADIAKSCPALAGGASITVYETIQVM